MPDIDRDQDRERDRRVPVRWIVGSILVAAIVGGCISAGFWQLRRLDERRAVNRQIVTRSGGAVALPPAGFGTGVDEDDLAYRRVRLRGTYDAEHEILLRFRTRTGLPGYEVVTPLLTTGGAVLVDRGWVPLDEGDRWPVAGAAAPPSGEVEVEGVLVPAEDGAVRIERPDDDARPVVAAALDPERLREALPYDDVYALPVLAAGPGGAYPAPVHPPGPGDGPHRSYAVQWFLFATVGIIGWVTLLATRGPFGQARRRRRAAPRAPRPTPNPS
jgi:cytochrome oxidase assembly protein ShyY1